MFLDIISWKHAANQYDIWTFIKEKQNTILSQLRYTVGVT